MSSFQPVLAKALADAPFDIVVYHVDPHGILCGILRGNDGVAADLLAALAADPATTEAVAAALHDLQCPEEPPHPYTDHMPWDDAEGDDRNDPLWPGRDLVAALFGKGGRAMTDLRRLAEAAPRSTFMVQSDFDRLEDWCRMVHVVFGPCHGPYLVGSATERADYRDVDIRVMVPDRMFDRLFRRRMEVVRYLNRAISVWGQQETGLPIDFQVQRMTEANAEFTKPRNPMGLRDWSTTPTSGVPK